MERRRPSHSPLLSSWLGLSVLSRLRRHPLTRLPIWAEILWFLVAVLLGIFAQRIAEVSVPVIVRHAPPTSLLDVAEALVTLTIALGVVTLVLALRLRPPSPAELYWP